YWIFPYLLLYLMFTPTPSILSLSLHDALPISGDVARNNANESHVQRTIVAALDAVLENRPEQGQVYLVLPEGSELQTYEFIRSRSEEHTSELQSRENLVCRLLLEKKKERNTRN